MLRDHRVEYPGESLTNTTKKLWVALTCATMTQHGIVLVLAGALLPAMMKTFGIRESAAGLMLGIGALGFVLGPLVAGMLSDRTEPKDGLPRRAGVGDNPADLFQLRAHLSARHRRLLPLQFRRRFH